MRQYKQKKRDKTIVRQHNPSQDNKRQDDPQTRKSITRNPPGQIQRQRQRQEDKDKKIRRQTTAYPSIEEDTSCLLLGWKEQAVMAPLWPRNVLMARHEKTREEKSSRVRTRQDKIRQSKIKNNKTRKAWQTIQHKTRHNITARDHEMVWQRQDKTKHGKTRQDKARQGKTRQGKARQGKTSRGMGRLHQQHFACYEAA